MNTPQAQSAPLTSATIEHGALCTPREPVKFGRTLAQPGQPFWITSPVYTRSRGSISIARSGRNAAAAQHLTLSDFDRYFCPLT